VRIRRSVFFFPRAAAHNDIRRAGLLPDGLQIRLFLFYRSGLGRHSFLFFCYSKKPTGLGRGGQQIGNPSGGAFARLTAIRSY